MMTLRTSLAAALTATFLAPFTSAQIGFQSATNHVLIGVRPASVATGDFDGVNGIDFAVSSSHLTGSGGPDRVELFLNQGNGTFMPGQLLVLGSDLDAAALVAGDFDNDLDVDLVVSLKNTDMARVLVNTGGVFALGAIGAVGGSEPEHMQGADMDGDGDMDLVTSNRLSNTVSILRNSGAATFTLLGIEPVELDPRHVALEDFDGDCRTDIAVAAHGSRRVDILFNQGGSFGGMLSLTLPSNERPSGMVAADLDGDGDVDLATTSENDSNQGQVVVLRNNGGTFTAAAFLSNGVSPDAIVAGDFDADGDKDLATADESTSRICVLANTGAGAFAAAIPFAVGNFPAGLATADFDDNGSPELASANRDSNNASVLTNMFAGGTSSFCATTPNSAGFGTRIDSTGSLSIAANAFTLLARCAPNNTSGLFFFGSTSTNIAFGNGQRCVGTPVVRLGPAIPVDASGHAVRLVDFTQLPGSLIQAGTTRYFQFWHHDVAGGGNAFDTSDGLSATFRP